MLSTVGSRGSALTAPRFAISEAVDCRARILDLTALVTHLKSAQIKKVLRWNANKAATIDAEASRHGQEVVGLPRS